MEKQGLLMRGFWQQCWDALKTIKTMGNTSKYYGKTRFTNVGILAEMLERIENNWNPWNKKKNTIEKQGLLMRGCWQKCWNALKKIKTLENTSKYYVKKRFTNAGILAEMLERIDNN